jgi:hypothetical protein
MCTTMRSLSHPETGRASPAITRTRRPRRIIAASGAFRASAVNCEVTRGTRARPSSSLPREPSNLAYTAQRSIHQNGGGTCEVRNYLALSSGANWRCRLPHLRMSLPLGGFPTGGIRALCAAAGAVGVHRTFGGARCGTLRRRSCAKSRPPCRPRVRAAVRPARV